MNAAHHVSHTTLLRLPEVCRRLGLGRTSIYRQMAADPTFPRPVRVTEHAVAWVEVEVEAFIAARIAASRTGQAAAA